MGQIVNALIEHNLTPEEVIELPKLLTTSSNKVIAGQWQWTVSQIDKNILVKLWSKKADYFINNSWSKDDLALLEKDNLTFHFFKPNLLTFDNSLQWYVYNRNDNLLNDFNKLSKEVAKLCRAVDVLIVPDLSDDFIDGQDKLTVELFRQKAGGDKNLALELE